MKFEANKEFMENLSLQDEKRSFYKQVTFALLLFSIYWSSASCRSIINVLGWTNIDI